MIPVLEVHDRIVVASSSPGVDPSYRYRLSDDAAGGRLVAVYAELLAGIGAGLREPQLVVRDVSGAVAFRSPAFSLFSAERQTTGEFVAYTWAVGLGVISGDTSSGLLSVPLPDMMLRGGEVIGIETTGLKDVDFWSGMILTID